MAPTESAQRFAGMNPELTFHLDYDDRSLDLARGDYGPAVRIGPLEDSALTPLTLLPPGLPTKQAVDIVEGYVDRQVGQRESPQPFSALVP